MALFGIPNELEQVLGYPHPHHVDYTKEHGLELTTNQKKWVGALSNKVQSAVRAIETNPRNMDLDFLSKNMELIEGARGIGADKITYLSILIETRNIATALHFLRSIST